MTKLTLVVAVPALALALAVSCTPQEAREAHDKVYDKMHGDKHGEKAVENDDHLAGKVAQPEGAESHAKGVDREQVDADGVVRRGKPLSASEALTVAIAKEKAGELEGKSVKVKGTVESVCQPQGCWFVIQGDTPEQRIRVSSKGHDVFVPKSAAGLKATVEGELKVKNVTQAVAQHYEDERALAPGEQRKVITGDQKELSIAVEALEMSKG